MSEQKTPEIGTFEENYAALSEIIGELEKGELTLEDSFEKYKLGMDKLKNCNTLLDKVEKELEILEEG